MRNASCFRDLESSRADVDNFASGVILGDVKRLHWNQWSVLAMTVPFVLGLNTVKHLQWHVAGPISYPKWRCRAHVWRLFGCSCAIILAPKGASSAWLYENYTSKDC